MEEKRKKKPLLLRALAFLFSAALVLGAVLLVIYRDQLNIDALQRYFAYRSLETNEEGQAESFPYDGSVDNSFATLDGSLLVASESGVRLYAPSGALINEETLLLSSPVVSSAGTYAVVYDVGGTALRLYNGTRQLLAEDCEGAILSARLNSAGSLAVTHQTSGSKGAVTVYDSEQNKTMQFSFSSRFVMDAVVVEDESAVAIVTVGQESSAFTSYLSLYDLNASLDAGTHYDHAPESELALGGTLALALKVDAGRIWVLGDNALLLCSETGGELARYDYSDRYLKEFSLDGEGCAVLLLGKYRAGSAAELVVVGSSGAETASASLNEQVLSLSAAGRYTGVLTADRLDIYTEDLRLYSTLDGTSGGRRVLMRSDGTAMLIGSESAHLYLPS